jgi:hypothetical protein
MSQPFHPPVTHNHHQQQQICPILATAFLRKFRPSDFHFFGSFKLHQMQQCFLIIK